MKNNKKEKVIYTLEIIKETVLKTGFPAELEVSSIFQKRFWTVNHSLYYIDQETDKTREFDMLCHIYESLECPEKIVEISLMTVVEVKKSDKPVVIFANKANTTENLLKNSVKYAQSNLKQINKLIRVYFKSKLDSIGRSSVHIDGSDILFEALISVTKAMDFLINRSYINVNSSEDKLAEIYEPIVVLDAPLYTAELNSIGELELHEKDEVLFKFNYLLPDSKKNDPTHTSRYIPVVKKDYLDRYLEDREKIFRSMCNELFKKLKSN